MKKLRITSLCLVMALILGIGSSCANEPGSTANTNTVPPAADIPITEENIAAEPVDLSGLTEEELEKLTDETLEALKKCDKTDILFVDIYLEKPEELNSFDSIVDEKFAHNLEQVEKIETELAELLLQYNNILNQENSVSAIQDESNIAVISERIDTLNEEISKYSTEYRKIQNEVFYDISNPVIQAFAERNNIDLDSAIGVFYSSPNIYTQLSAERILEIVQDDSVSKIQFRYYYDEVYGNT